MVRRVRPASYIAATIILAAAPYTQWSLFGAIDSWRRSVHAPTALVNDLLMLVLFAPIVQLLVTGA